MTTPTTGSAVDVRTRVVYYSPRSRRHFMTAKAAARAEAAARIKRFFPTERAEKEDGIEINPGWHFTDDERLVGIWNRLSATYLKRANQRAKQYRAALRSTGAQ